MTNTEIPAPVRLHILRLLIAGKTLGQAATAASLPQHEILAVGQKYGHPNHDSMFRGAVQLYQQLNPAPAPTAARTATTGDITDQLLEEAAEHPSAKIRTRAERIRASLATLSHEVREERATRAAAEKVQRITEALEQAREELRAARGKPATTKPATATTPSNAEEIRTWARQNGHQIGDHGRIPAKIRAAYDKQHQPA